MNSHASKGLTLVELMIATALGVFLIAGVTDVYLNSRKAYDVYQTSARLQETARYAIGVIEPDVRLANYWGLLKGGGLLTGSADQGAATAASPLTAVFNTPCGKNFATDLGTYIQGNNDGYALACAAYLGRPVTSADTLTVRRASTAAIAPAAALVGPLRVCTTRTFGQLVTDATPCTAAPIGQIADLIVHTFYVSQDSVQAAGVPALHEWTLAGFPLGFNDVEVVSGVEDLQVQFGIDPTGTTGTVTQYVDPFGPLLLPPGAQIAAVRIWLLVRSDAIEVGFVDNTVYQYANRNIANGTTNNLSAAGSGGLAYAPADNYRRLLISRTIMLRNSIGT